MKHLVICLLALGVSMLNLSTPSAAQDDGRPSHDFSGKTLQPKNISKILDARRGQKRPGGGTDLDMLRKLAEQFGGIIDPTKIDPQMIRRFVENNPEFRDPEKLEKLRDALEKQIRENPDRWDPEKIQQALKRLEDLRNDKIDDPKIDRNNPPKIDPKIDPNIPPEVKQPPQEKKPESKKEAKKSTEDELAKWARKNLGDSPAMDRIAKDLSQRLKQATKDQIPGLPKLKNDWLKFDWNKKKSTATDKKDGTSSSWGPSLKLPDLGSGSKTPRPPSTDSFSRTTGFSSSSGSGSRGDGSLGLSGASIVLVLLLLLGGVAAWFFLKKAPLTPGMEASALPAPLCPLNEVSTREELIAAFEHLSVTKCGREARNWHHHQIAENLGKTAPDHQRAAQFLAELYEKARYAPAPQEFSEAEMREARYHLSLLAGEASA